LLGRCGDHVIEGREPIPLLAPSNEIDFGDLTITRERDPRHRSREKITSFQYEPQLFVVGREVAFERLPRLVTAHACRVQERFRLRPKGIGERVLDHADCQILIKGGFAHRLSMVEVDGCT
jgi:hypothetical protein